jgi:hypothetical protein
MHAPNHVQEDEVAPTKPKDKASNGRHQPKKSKEINKAQGRQEDRNQEHPRQSSTDFVATKENKEGVVSKESTSKSSTPGLDEHKIN